MTSRHSGNFSTGFETARFCYPSHQRRMASRWRHMRDTDLSVSVSRSPANSEWEPIMSPTLDAAEFIRLSPIQRVAKCRAMAAEAERLAADARGEMRASYSTLATQWSQLADEMASISQE